ncbi:MAG: helix-turn-helix transcriptional regulator [Candidatus Omnitrophica bacterium]|nr:helix-turn-helix transcriptional regulator [Candidatus Omnitrophota bacterium]
MKYKIESVDEHIKEKLKDPYFKELHELEHQKLGLVKKIISYRVNNNITQDELADQVGVTQQHISKIENCEFTDPVTLAKVLLFVGFRVHMKAEPIRPVTRKKIRRVIQKLAMA